MDLSKKRNSFFDLCKSVAILLVIVTHMNVFSNGLCRKTILYFVINQAVPLFMIVSGFLLSASYCKSVCSGNMPLGRWYARRFLRLLPFCLIVLIIEALFIGKDVSLLHFFLQGGDGPGAYYICCIVQVVLIFPLLFSLHNLWYVVMLNVVYEIAVRIFGMNPELYALLCFRYLFLICIGIWTYRRQSAVFNNGMIPVFITGCIYLGILISGILPDDGYWLGTNLLNGLYIGPLFCFLFSRYSTVLLGGIVGWLIGIIGKSTWHIFLIQKVGFELLWHVKIGFLQIPGMRLIVLPVVFVGIGMFFFMLEQTVVCRLSAWFESNGKNCSHCSEKGRP